MLNIHVESVISWCQVTSIIVCKNANCVLYIEKPSNYIDHETKVPIHTAIIQYVAYVFKYHNESVIIHFFHLSAVVIIYRSVVLFAK